MKINSKLVMLVGSTLALFLVAIGLYFMLLAPLDKIESEKSYFDQISRSAMNLRTQAYSLLSVDLRTSNKAFLDARKVFDDAQDNIARVVYLRKLGSSVQGALKAVVNLKALSSSNLDSIQSEVDELMKSPQISFYQFEVLSLILSFGTSQQTPDPLVLYNVGNLRSDLSELDQVLMTTISIVDKQAGIVNQVVQSVKQQSLALAGLFVLIVFVAAVLLSFLLARSISSSVISIVRPISKIAEGDLTLRLDIKSKDEIGALGRNFNQLLDSFSEAMSHIQSAANENSEMKSQLAISVSSATSSTEEIQANSKSIQNQMERLDKKIDESGVAIQNVRDVFGVFNKKVSEQNRHVEDSVASVTQMLASIENITRVTQRDRQIAEDLVGTAVTGNEVFESFFEKVSEIGQSIEQIQGMADVIAELATRTNILALNAAIEAAHAGEFGKGFAIVADEIGRLAAASSSSSAEIAQTIQVVTGKINEASVARSVTGESFSNISEKIHVVSESVSEIYSNVNEMQTGSHQILDAMEQLRAFSSQITKESGGIDQGTELLSVTIGDVGRISHEVVANISEIGAGLSEITRAIHEVADHAEKIGVTGTKLDKAVGRFRTA